MSTSQQSFSNRVKDGWTQARGRVRDWADRRRAERDARRADRNSQPNEQFEPVIRRTRRTERPVDHDRRGNVVTRHPVAFAGGAVALVGVVFLANNAPPFGGPGERIIIKDAKQVRGAEFGFYIGPGSGQVEALVNGRRAGKLINDETGEIVTRKQIGILRDTRLVIDGGPKHLCASYSYKLHYNRADDAWDAIPDLPLYQTNIVKEGFRADPQMGGNIAGNRVCVNTQIEARGIEGIYLDFSPAAD